MVPFQSPSKQTTIEGQINFVRRFIDNFFKELVKQIGFASSHGDIKILYNIPIAHFKCI